MLEFSVDHQEDRERLDRVLAARVPALSRMRLRQALDEGEILVNGDRKPAGARVRAGDSVRVLVALDQATAMTPEPIPLSILHEDPDLVVVEKPAGMVVHPAGSHRSGTLANALAYHFNVTGGAEPPIRPGMVHRLDRATSGLMVIAKTQAALSHLTVQFQNRTVEKGYLGLVHGSPVEGRGEWEAPIGYDAESRPRWNIRPEGKPARSRYRVRERLPAHALLELEPITGRTNQLRLHASYFGCPLVGDELFGRGAEDDLARLFLHAFRLGFDHPRSSERLLFEIPLPPDLLRYLERLRGVA